MKVALFVGGPEDKALREYPELPGDEVMFRGLPSPFDGEATDHLYKLFVVRDNDGRDVNFYVYDASEGIVPVLRLLAHAYSRSQSRL